MFLYFFNSKTSGKLSLSVSGTDLDAYVDTRKIKVNEFFTFIDSEFAEAQRFIKKISEGLDAGETVSFDLLGSASSITDDAYNINLSKNEV